MYLLTTGGGGNASRGLIKDFVEETGVLLT